MKPRKFKIVEIRRVESINNRTDKMCKYDQAMK